MIVRTTTSIHGSYSMSIYDPFLTPCHHLPCNSFIFHGQRQEREAELQETLRKARLNQGNLRGDPPVPIPECYVRLLRQRHCNPLQETWKPTLPPCSADIHQYPCLAIRSFGELLASTTKMTPKMDHGDLWADSVHNDTFALVISRKLTAWGSHPANFSRKSDLRPRIEYFGRGK